MKVNIKTDGMDITPAIGDYVNKKISAFDKFIKGDESICDLYLGRSTNHHKSGDIFKTEINLYYSGENFNTVSEKDDLYSAIDDSKDQVVGLLRSHKSRKLTLFRKGGAKIKEIIRGFRKNG